MLPDPGFGKKHLQGCWGDFLKHHDVRHISREQLGECAITLFCEEVVEPDVERRQDQLVAIDGPRRVGVAPMVGCSVEPADRNDAGLASLAGHFHHAVPEVEPRQLEPHQFRQPQAGRIEKLEHRTVPQLERRRRRCFQQLARFIRRQGLG